jgi:Gpi18-like mannosyltransferase
MDLFVSWLRTAADYGPGFFYKRVYCDYPPFNIYLFWVFGYVAKSLSLFETNLITYIVKLIPSLFDIATTCLIFVFVRARSGFRVSLVTAAAYAFNPAIIFNSSIWGQFDSIYTFLILLSFVWVLSSKPSLSVATFTLAVLTKPQSIALAPLLAFLVYKKYGLRRTLASTLIIVTTTLFVVIPIQWDNPITFLTNIYLNGYGTYPYTSVNAFNLWGIFGFWKPDTSAILFINLFMIGWGMFAVVTFLTLNLIDMKLKSSGDMLVLFAAFVLLFSFFMLPTRIHERYNFPSLSFLALMIPFLRKMRVIYAVLTVTLFTNLAYAMTLLNSNLPIPDGDPLAICMSLVNIVVFTYVMVLMRRGLKGSDPQIFALN